MYVPSRPASPESSLCHGHPAAPPGGPPTCFLPLEVSLHPLGLTCTEHPASTPVCLVSLPQHGCLEVYPWCTGGHCSPARSTQRVDTPPCVYRLIHRRWPAGFSLLTAVKPQPRARTCGSAGMHCHLPTCPRVGRLGVRRAHLQLFKDLPTCLPGELCCLHARLQRARDKPPYPCQPFTCLLS